MGFKDDYDIESRKSQSKEALDKFYPYKVPVIIQKHHTERHLQSFKRRKYLIPRDMKYSSLLFCLRRKVVQNVSPDIAIYLMTENGKLLCNTDDILSIYHRNCNKEDGFLYLYYCSENTFG